ncbi:hypothetical protein [Mycobacteroides abscessus]|uniref:hypothetical protein n=1 Tax=Mycobacteroides abscessus TaxID=36809 RepID=UPI0005DCD517|nr:hypothetical protein [Mycobacteroides abscessus]CPW40662.1 Uncharacterised protein [Mycobacteroides abscessus]SKF60074.1 Uncharacterised protein [Mycobacteroides abscessus subsp. bolletii]SKH51420.1 Uncharacterised protein [Mycobacteroides abscessus subsp. bolletii]
MMLTEDQRWLLRMVGGWAIVDCLIGPEGVTHLMQSLQSSTGSKRPGIPDYIEGYQCGRGKIVTPWRGEPRVIVTAAQINRYARSLPDELKAELREHAWRRNTNRYRGYQHCFCQSTPCGYGYIEDKFHPTDEQVRDHAEEWNRLHCWENSLLDRALGVAHSDEPAGQLELFEVGA